MLKYLDDILIILGCLAITIGTYLICQVATWFVGGVFLIMLGISLGFNVPGGKPK